MHWLLYSSKMKKGSRKIEKSFEGIIRPDCSTIQCGIEKLDNYLSRPHEIITHALLLVSNQDDLIKLAKYRDQIREWRTIIGTLDAGEGNVMRMALRFNPRFVAILPEEEEHLHLVVERMIQNCLKKDSSLHGIRRKQTPGGKKKREKD